jgi:hypothetical protein
MLEGKPKKEVVENFRLKTGHGYVAAHIRKVGIYESSECTICQMPNSNIALNLILTNKCSRTLPHSTGMTER